MSEILSALTDGQAGPQEVTRATAAWRDDPQARATWHSYQLIGDALRSPDLLQASDGAAFLQSFRARLAQEPVILAPQPARLAQPSPEAQVAETGHAHALKRRPWAGPAAVAASFVLLVGVMASNLSGLGLGGGQPGGADTLAAVQNPAWQTQSGAGFGQMASALNMSLSPSVNPSQARLQSAQSMGASFDRPDQTEAVLIRDPRVEPLLSLQRPMVIDAAPTSFAEPGLIRQTVDMVPPAAP